MADKKQKPDNADQPKETPDGDMVVRTMGRDFRVEGNDVDGYIGVDPEYRTYANQTERPFVTEGDIEILEKGGQPTDVEMLTQQVAAENRRQAAANGDTEEKSNEESGTAKASPTDSPTDTSRGDKADVKSETTDKPPTDAEKRLAEDQKKTAASKAVPAK